MDWLIPNGKKQGSLPNSIPIEFYQACWLIVKSDIV